MNALLVEADPLQAKILSGFLREGGFSVEVHATLPAAPERFDLVVMEQASSEAFLISNARRPPRERLPVILLVDDAAQADVIQGLESGHYTAGKPVGRALLLALAERAIRSRNRLRDLSDELARDRESLRHLVEARFEFRTREEACAIAGTLSQAFPPSNLLSVGIMELLVNAIEHGNLEIGGLRKQALLESGRLDDEIVRRLRDPRLGSRYATAQLRRFPDRLRLVVEDQGPGFDPSALSYDPRAHHGRGLQLARAVGFDSLEHEPPGNRVVAVMRLNVEGEQPHTLLSRQALALVD